MTDLFKEKAEDWDSRPIPAQISAGVGAALLDRIAWRKDMHVMDFGAGTGLVSSNVAPLVAKIYAVDISEAMLEKLAAKPELRGIVEVACQDILEVPLGKPVDVIMSAMAMHHIEDTEELVKTFSEHLESGGQVALADLDTEDGSFHPAGTDGVYHNGIDRTRLETLLRAHGFVDMEFTTALTVAKEGVDYPIFLVTARKG